MAIIYADDDYVAALAAERREREARLALMTPEEIEALEAEEERQRDEENFRFNEELEREDRARRDRERRPIKNLRLRIKKLVEPRLAAAFAATAGSRERNMLGWFAVRRLANKLPIVLPDDTPERRSLLAEGKGGVLATLEKGVSVLVFPLHDRAPGEVWDVLVDGIRETERVCVIRVEDSDFAKWWSDGMQKWKKWAAKINARNAAAQAKKEELYMQAAMAARKVGR